MFRSNFSACSLDLIVNYTSSRAPSTTSDHMNVTLKLYDGCRKLVPPQMLRKPFFTVLYDPIFIIDNLYFEKLFVLAH